jgi:hypothetical protein
VVARQASHSKHCAQPDRSTSRIDTLRTKKIVALDAFAPLNGLVTTSTPPPALPDPAEAARQWDAVPKELDAARKLIAECGYHRRDGELAELDAVVTGRRRFADLPARI